MRMPPGLKSFYRKLGRIEKSFLILVVSPRFSYLVPASFVSLLLTFAAWIAGFIVAVRLAKTGVKKLIWRLRNRLIVAYAFIAMVPIVLILALVLVSAYGLTGQIAVYLINSELDRRTSILNGSAAGILEAPPEHRPEVFERTQDFLQRFFPSTEILVRDGGDSRYPAPILFPPRPTHGKMPMASSSKAGSSIAGPTLLARTPGRHHGAARPGVPLRPSSRLGEVNFRDFTESSGGLLGDPAGTTPRARIPPETTRSICRSTGDRSFPSPFGTRPATKSARTAAGPYPYLRRAQHRLRQYPGARRYGLRPGLLGVFLVTVTLFLIVELVSLVIGVSISRTITSAVHELYLGTRRVKEGDFSYRIPVQRRRPARRNGRLLQHHDREPRAPDRGGQGKGAP